MKWAVVQLVESVEAPQLAEGQEGLCCPVAELSGKSGNELLREFQKNKPSKNGLLSLAIILHFLHLGRFSRLNRLNPGQNRGFGALEMHFRPQSSWFVKSAEPPLWNFGRF